MGDVTLFISDILNDTDTVKDRMQVTQLRQDKIIPKPEVCFSCLPPKPAEIFGEREAVINSDIRYDAQITRWCYYICPRCGLISPIKLNNFSFACLCPYCGKRMQKKYSIYF